MAGTWRETASGILLYQGDDYVRLCRADTVSFELREPIAEGDVYVVDVVDNTAALDLALTHLLSRGTSPTWLCSTEDTIRRAQRAGVPGVWAAWKVARPELDWVGNRLRVIA